MANVYKEAIKMPFAGFAAITLPRMRVVVLAVGQGLPGYTAAVHNCHGKNYVQSQVRLCNHQSSVGYLILGPAWSGLWIYRVQTEHDVFVWTAGEAGFHSSPKINWADSILTMAKKGV
jgi:hypothetical protein